MKISQREAQQLRRRVRELEQVLSQQRNSWVKEWPEGVHIQSVSASHEVVSIVNVARKLGHAVVVTQVNSEKIELYAMKLERMEQLK